MTPHFHTCRTVFRIQLAQIAGRSYPLGMAGAAYAGMRFAGLPLGKHQRTIA
jgi:hypothetical protein